MTERWRLGTWLGNDSIQKNALWHERGDQIKGTEGEA